MKAKLPILLLTLISVFALAIMPLADTEEVYAAKLGDVNYDISNITSNGTSLYTVGSPDLDVMSGHSMHIEMTLYSPTDTKTFWITYSSNSDLISNVSVDNSGVILLPVNEFVKLMITVDTQQNVHGLAQLNLTLYIKDIVTELVSEVDIVIGIAVLSSVGGEGYYNKVFGIYPLDSPLNDPGYAALFTFALWVIIGALISHLVVPLILRILRRRNAIDRELTNGLGTSVLLVAIVAGTGQTMRVYGSPDYLISIVDVASLVLYIALGAIITWKIYIIIMDRMFRRRSSLRTGLDETLIPLFRMIGKIMIATFAVATIFSALGGNLLSILAGAGIVGLAISLGAQNTLNQFFSGLSLLIARPFREGDIVKIGSEGTVLKVNKVGLMNTAFFHNDNEQIISMPNDVVATSTIYNYTSENPYFHIYVYFSVAYGSDIEKAKNIILGAAMENPNVMKGGSVPMPGVRMTALEASSVTIRLSIYVYEYNDSFSTDGVIREKVYYEFLKNGIQIPYPQLDVHLKTEPADDDGVKVTQPARKHKEKSDAE